MSGHYQSVGDESHDGFYNIFLRRHFHPFILKFHRPVCLFWIAILITSAAFAPTFFTLLNSDGDSIDGLPSQVALNAMKQYFPLVSAGSWSAIRVIQKSARAGAQILSSPLLINQTRSISASLAAYQSSHSHFIRANTGYWEYMAHLDAQPLASACVSPDGAALLTTLSVTGSVEDAKQLSDFVNALATDELQIWSTSDNLLFDELSTVTESNFALIEAIVVPIAILVIGWRVRSYRHMFIVICNLICTLVLSFALMVPIAKWLLAVDSLTPSIMLAVGDAICFDYSLFMIARFKEELDSADEKAAGDENRIDEGSAASPAGSSSSSNSSSSNPPSPSLTFPRSNKLLNNSVYEMLAAAGHVVILSGFTLLATFLLLVIFPEQFLRSVGAGCTCVVVSGLLCCYTLTPALILTFEWFSTFELLPKFISNLFWSTEESSGLSARAPSTKLISAYGAVSPSERSTAGEEAAQTDAPPRFSERSVWFRLAWIVTGHSTLVCFIVVLLTAPLLYCTLQLAPTGDQFLLFVLNGRYLQARLQLDRTFAPGLVRPYFIISICNQSGAVTTPEHFQLESDIIRTLLQSQPTVVNPNISISSMSYFEGQFFEFSTAVQFLTPESPLYNSSLAVDYRAIVGSTLVNRARSAALIRINTMTPPDSQSIVPFIRQTRTLLTEMTAKSSHPPYNQPTQLYLIGSFETTVDLQDKLYQFVPYEVAATIGLVFLLVGISFGSFGLSLRLAVTVLISLIWSFGLMTLVYQPGPVQSVLKIFAPSLDFASGVYWLIPIMSFSILVGLALDYDIFLMSRVVEFRRRGWSDRASVCLAMDKTGSIISAAGIIMAVSFAGLFLKNSLTLNQFGFGLFFGVVIDTFVIRTLAVPAIITLLRSDISVFMIVLNFCAASVNWWPSKMPVVVLNEAEEERALLDRDGSLDS